MNVLHMSTESVMTLVDQLQVSTDSVRTHTQQLQHSANDLTGSWHGPSADHFHEEAQALYHALLRLVNEGEALTARLRQEVEEWLEVDSAFAGVAIGAAIGGLPVGGDGAPMMMVPHVEPAPGQWQFHPDEMIGYDPYAEWGNADAARLGEAMAAFSHYLHENPHLLNEPYTLTPELQAHLQALADGRGMSYEQVLEQYGQFVQLSDSVPTPTMRNDYWGSVQQLRYGRVVGDALNIDPVFGSLLNPTGGLVGPGDSDLHNVLGGLDFMQYHGAYHDAAGYLHSHHQIGPGYEYLVPGRVDNLAELSTGGPVIHQITEQFPPLDGQETGIAYWMMKLHGGDTGGMVTEGLLDVLVRIDSVGDSAVERFNNLRDIL